MSGAWHPMENTLLYRLWQAPFAEQKLRPFLARTSGTFGRVLDVGCGPGTNARHFTGTDYLGIDLNPAYIRSATRRFGPRFRVQDVTTLQSVNGEQYDCILVNSLLHHLPDAEVRRLLSHLRGLLSVGGRVHVLDLVLPDSPGPPRWLALVDRGQYPRPLLRWKTIFQETLGEVEFEPYALKLGPVTLWQMVYCVGQR